MPTRDPAAGGETSFRGVNLILLGSMAQTAPQWTTDETRLQTG
jgi:hypothetical protein